MNNFFSVFRAADDILFNELPKQTLCMQCSAAIPTTH